MKKTFDQNYIINEINRQKRLFGESYQKAIDLEFEYGVFADDALDILRNYPFLRKLTIFHCGNVSDAKLESLSELNELERLCVAGTQCDGSFLQYVNPNVDYLRFKYSRFSESNARFLERFVNIGQIDLEYCGVDDVVVDTLTNQPLNRLSDIGLYNGHFQKQTKKELITPRLTTIRLIECSGCTNMTKILRAVHTLERIDVRYSDFYEEDIIRLLASADQAKRSLYLDFSGTSVSDRTLEYIASSSLPYVSHLFLDDTSVTQKGIRTLAQCEQSKELSVLGLTDICDLDLNFIISAFPNIWEIHVPYGELNSCNIPKSRLRLESESRRVAIYSVKRANTQIVFLKTPYKYYYNLVRRVKRYSF